MGASALRRRLYFRTRSHMSGEEPGSKTSRADKFDGGDLIAPKPIETLGKLPLLGTLVGIVVGLLGVAFLTVSQIVMRLLFGSVGHVQIGEHGAGGWLGNFLETLPAGDPAEPRLWVMVVFPLAGGLLLALWMRVTKDATPTDTGIAVGSFHNDRGRFPRGTVWKKFVASTITLGSGAASGREGPIAHMGAAAGSWLAQRLNLTVRQRRILLLAGIAAGIGGMFRAPLAGGLMAGEVLYADSEFEADALVPAVMASIASYCVFCLNFGWGSLFGGVATAYHFANPLELAPMALLAVSLTIAGFLFVKIYQVTHKLFNKVHWLARPALGAALAGGLTLAVYGLSALLSEDGQPKPILLAVMGDGYPALEQALHGQGLWWILLIVAGAKIVASALTVGSGGAGGQFAPAVVIGGTIGAGVGMVCYSILPSFLLPVGLAGTDPQAATAAVFALIGMAGFWAGVAKVPFSSVIIVCELTGSYHLLLPALWTCSITFVLSRRFRLIETQVPTRRQSPAHAGAFSVNVLREIRVADVLPDLGAFETVLESTSLAQVLQLKSSRQAYFPVVTKAGKFVGVFSLSDVRTVLSQSEVWQLLVAADIVQGRIISVKPADTLADVAARFAESRYDELPVVADDDPTKLVGIISRRQLNNAYLKRTMLYDEAARLEHSAVGTSSRQ